MIQTQHGTISVKRHRLRSDAKSIAFLQLSRLLTAGVALTDALDDLADADDSRVSRRLWAEVGYKVKSGQALSRALEASGFSAEKTVLALLRAGESSGDLDKACRAVNEYLQWHHNLRRRLITLLIYPLFSLGVLTGVTGFLFISVVPSIQGFLISTGGELQWHTRALLAVSTWMSQHYAMALLLVTFFAFAVSLLTLFSLRVRMMTDALILQTPLFGSVVIDLSLSRYARCCAQLYASGVALETSLELAEATVPNRVVCAALTSARHSMVSGTSLAESMQQTRVLPSIFIRLIAVGERSGQLASVLTQLSVQQSATAEASIKRMEQMIGPSLLLVVGAVLLWIVISVLGPVYNMAIATVVGAA